MKFFETLPPEIRDEVNSYHRKYDCLTVMTAVSRDFNAQIKEYLAKNAGTNYADFVQRTQALQPEQRNLVLSNKYTLRLAEDIIGILALPPIERASRLFTPEQAAALRPSLIDSLSSNYGVLALREGLFTLKQLSALRQVCSITLLLTDHCIQALREGLISLEQVDAVVPIMKRHILSFNGIVAISEGLITLEQAAAMPNSAHLQHLFSVNGISALRKKLITVEQAANYSHVELHTQLYKLTGKPDVRNSFCSVS